MRKSDAFIKALQSSKIDTTAIKDNVKATASGIGHGTKVLGSDLADVAIVIGVDAVKTGASILGKVALFGVKSVALLGAAGYNSYQAGKATAKAKRRHNKE